MEDRSSQVIAVASLFFALTWLTVCLRVFVRIHIIKAFGIDDYAMLATLALYTAYLSCQLGGAAHGTGQHRAAITDENAQIALRYWFFCEVFYTLATSVLKVAIGLFLLRITIVPFQVWTIRILMASSAVLGLAYCMVVIFQCQPVSYWWDLNPDHHGTCLSASLVADATYVVSALNSAADWTFGILPVFIVKDLQMKTSVKIIVCTIIGFAAIGNTATIIRLPYTWTMKEYKGDFLYRTIDFAIWTTVEVGIGITAGCMATLKPLMKQFFTMMGVQSTSPLESSLPYTGKRSRRGNTIIDQPLDNLRPAGGKSVTTVTASGRRKSQDSEEDMFFAGAPPGMDYLDLKNKSAWKGGINKTFAVTTTEERNASMQKPREDESLSGDTDEERSLPNKAAMVYERF